jgi:hypothetical protein
MPSLASLTYNSNNSRLIEPVFSSDLGTLVPMVALEIAWFAYIDGYSTVGAVKAGIKLACIGGCHVEISIFGGCCYRFALKLARFMYYVVVSSNTLANYFESMQLGRKLN